MAEPVKISVELTPYEYDLVQRALLALDGDLMGELALLRGRNPDADFEPLHVTMDEVNDLRMDLEVAYRVAMHQCSPVKFG